MKRFIIAALILVLVVGTAIFFINKNKNKAGEEYSPVKVTRKDLKDTVASSGTINAFRVVEVKSKASGEILRLNVKEGDVVKKGQLLLTLDKTDEQSLLNQCKASVMSAEAGVTQAREKLKDAERNYQQQTQLAKDKLAPQEQVLQALSNKNLADASLKIAQSSLINAQEKLKAEAQRFADTELRAPIDGVVLQQLVEEGQIIASGISSNTGGTLIFVLGDISRIIVKAEIDEVDVSKIHVGQQVDISVDAYERRHFRGKLTHISPQAINKSNVTVFDVEIEVTDPDKDLLKPGMTATAEIVISEKPNAVAVPSQAVYTRRKGAVVYVRENGKFVPKHVTKGIETDEDTEITQGLNGTETVYVRGTAGLQGNSQGRGGRQSRPGFGVMGRMH